MSQLRTAVLGAIAGSAVTILASGFLACSKGEKTTGAKQAASSLPAQSQEELNKVIAEIDDVRITVGDFQDRINKQSPYIRARYTSLERKKEFLDNLVRFEVLAKEAKRRGLDQDPEVVRTMKQVMIQKLMKDEFDTRVKPEDITDDECRKFYDEHSADYNKPEEVRVSAIVVKDKGPADKVASEVKGPKGKDNKVFRDLVTQYSIDEDSKLRGGDLRFFAADTKELPPEVVKTAFTLKNGGDVAGPIKTDKGWYVIKQTGRRPALSKTFDEVKQQIRNRIYRDKRTKAMEDFVTGLKEKAKVVVHEDALAAVQVDTAGMAPGMEGMPPHHGMAPPPGMMPRPQPGRQPAPGPRPPARPAAATPPANQ